MTNTLLTFDIERYRAIHEQYTTLKTHYGIIETTADSLRKTTIQEMNRILQQYLRSRYGVRHVYWNMEHEMTTWHQRLLNTLSPPVDPPEITILTTTAEQITVPILLCKNQPTLIFD